SAPSTMPSVGAVAARAGVSRLSVYHHFGSKGGLIDAVAAEARGDAHQDRPAPAGESPLEELQALIGSSCERWAGSPALFRALPAATGVSASQTDRDLVGRLAAADLLRPGCSLKEAEDVIGLLTSFAAFDWLYRDGRRSAAAVSEILR